MPHNTICISIQRSRYDTYLDTYLNTVRRQRDVVSNMKAQTPVIRSTMHNLLLYWMEYLPFQLLLFETKLDFAELYQSQSISINLIIKKYVLWLWFTLFKNTCAYNFKWIVIHWVCRIDTYHSDKRSVHRDALVNRYTPSLGDWSFIKIVYHMMLNFLFMKLSEGDWLWDEFALKRSIAHNLIYIS